MTAAEIEAQLAAAAKLAQDKSTTGNGMVMIRLDPLGFLIEATRVVDAQPRRARFIIGYGEAFAASIDLFGPAIDRVLGQVS